MGKIISILCLLFPILWAGAQEGDQGVPWREDLRLSWSDFKGEVPKGAVAAATTASGISYSYSANLLHHEVILDFQVTAYFYPWESWYRPQLCNDNTLAHEQLHFDISELFARKMRDRLERTTFSEDVKEEIRKIYKEILAELRAFQARYDRETDFSRNRPKQAEWNLRVAQALR